MNWLEIGNVQFLDYSYHDWTKGVKLGYLISFSEKDGILIRDSQSFELIFNNVSYGGKKLYYYIFEEELFFTVNDRIFKFDFGIKALISQCNTNEEYIGMVNENLAIGSTFRRRPRINQNELIKLTDCSIIYNWSDERRLIEIINNELLVFVNDINAKVIAISLADNNVLWELPLIGYSFPRFFEFLSDDIFIVIQSFDTDHPVEKRFELWGVNTMTGKVCYQLDVGIFNKFILNDEKKLFGISGQKYLCVDPVVGKILVSKEIKELDKLWADIGNQSITGIDIFFIVFGKPLVGRFNTKSQKVEEFISISVDDRKVDMSQPLGVPLYHNKKLYVRDNSGVMHVLQREDHPA